MQNIEGSKDVYAVAIVINERAYCYPGFCLNHQQALEKAFAAHQNVLGPVPMGTRCLVNGTCHDTGCPERGKNLTIDGVTDPEGFRVINYQHN